MMSDWIDIFKDKLREERPSVPNDDWDVMSRLLDSHIHRKSMVKWSLGAIPLAAAILVIVFLTNIDETETTAPSERLVAETLVEEAHTNSVEPVVEVFSAPGHPETAAIVDEEVVEKYELSTDTPRVASEEQESLKHSEPIEPVVVEDNDQWWSEATESRPIRKRIARVDFSSSLMLLLQKAGGQVLVKNGVSYFSSYSISQNNQQGLDNPHLPELPYPVKIGHSHPYTLGMTVSYPLSGKFSISTGLDYSICDSRITYSDESLVNQSAHYLGVPLRLDWIPLSTNKMFIYAGAGAEAYRCLLAKQGQDTRLKDTNVYYSAIVVGGLRYEPVRRVGLFIEPQLSYNFLREDPAVLSSITDSKTLFNLRAGISFSFGR